MINNHKPKSEDKKIKCVVWDLDNTLWDGILLEDKDVVLRKNIYEIILQLDARGILQSITSKNEYSVAYKKMEELGIDEYFLYPQIKWNAKSKSVQSIAEYINIGLDTVAFIDDQDYELEEVKTALPEVRCYHVDNIHGFLDLPETNPRFITKDSKKRRLMYLGDMKRNKEEESFDGPKEEFLEKLGMKLIISPVEEGDLQRAEELTVRTHQLNATGYTYSYEELDSLRKSKQHKLFIASMEDKFGSYGKIGLVLIECKKNVWTLKLLLMSCRVMSRGVGSIILNYVMRCSKESDVRLLAEFVQTERNRMMFITYKFAGFNEIEQNDQLILLEADLSKIQPFPSYVDFQVYE